MMMRVVFSSFFSIFKAGDLRYSSLIKSIINSPEYQLGSASLDDPRAKSAAKITHPTQMALGNRGPDRICMDAGRYLNARQ